VRICELDFLRRFFTLTGSLCRGLREWGFEIIVFSGRSVSGFFGLLPWGSVSHVGGICAAETLHAPHYLCTLYCLNHAQTSKDEGLWMKFGVASFVDACFWGCIDSMAYSCSYWW
jgi:hypothetical protein